MAFSPITSWQIEEEKMVVAAMKIKKKKKMLSPCKYISDKARHCTKKAETLLC